MVAAGEACLAAPHCAYMHTLCVEHAAQWLGARGAMQAGSASSMRTRGASWIPSWGIRNEEDSYGMALKTGGGGQVMKKLSQCWAGSQNRVFENEVRRRSRLAARPERNGLRAAGKDVAIIPGRMRHAWTHACAWHMAR